MALHLRSGRRVPLLGLAVVVCLLCASAAGAKVSTTTTGTTLSRSQRTLAASLPGRLGRFVDDDSFLNSWFQYLMPAIGNQTLLQLSLPGTHDSLTYDMSTTISDNANDMSPTLAWILHLFKDFLDVGTFVRDLAKTQGLNITQQLDAGMRFIDFRIDYTAGPNSASWDKHEWYGVHMVESEQTAMTYLEEINTWMRAHPQEIIMLVVSRHGSLCSTQYPDTPLSAMQGFFANTTALFDGLLFNNEESQLNSTTVAELVQRNHRLVLYVADYKNFTAGGSPYAMDTCLIYNLCSGNGLSDTPQQLATYMSDFQNGHSIVANNSKRGGIWVRQMAAGAPKLWDERAAYVYFVPFDKDDNRQKCAALMNIPNMTGFCPMYDQAAAQLANYYNQLVLDAAVEQNLGLPNAFYIDAVAEGGLIRTGVQLFPSGKMPAYPPAPATGVHTTTGYAYADSILLWNVRQVCGMPADSEAARQALAPETSAACTQLEALLSARRARNPLQRWSDPTYGRLLDWPPGF